MRCTGGEVSILGGLRTVKPIVLLTWNDSESLSGWVSELECRNMSVSGCFTVGFLVEENDDVVIVSASHDLKNENFESPIAIPKFAIDEIRYLDWEEIYPKEEIKE